MSKPMPEEIQELEQCERLLAHLEDGYDLDAEDAEHMRTLTSAFKLIHDEESQDTVLSKLKTVFHDKSGKQIEQILNDTTFVFGDFFVVNQAAMRIIQERRHERIFEAALAAGEFKAAESAAKSIDQLNHLYDVKNRVPNSNRKLPKVRRTSDPATLKKLTGND